MCKGFREPPQKRKDDEGLEQLPAQRKPTAPKTRASPHVAHNIDTIPHFAGYGVQQVVTIIDSDLPVGDNGKRLGFRPGEVILTLHDQGPDGRLFRMAEW